MRIERDTEFLQGEEFRDAFQKNTVTVRCVQHFPIHTINVTDLYCQSLVMSAFQKLHCHKLKLQLNLKKNKYSHAMPMLLTTTILNLRL